ncbi:MND1-interacting protein 1-like [Zingiber officinale]|uniref:RING-type domain-containing protein n=1 Tax=Zingiber officinale TaxID=94328 RepID=A0A8J5HSN1_ZINOF|nr:MND1-interacting protein 1-like [Zingiber officinale]KAG6526389.1 hypothetical protein ZIOFF_016373 [Zingiber officinale]
MGSNARNKPIRGFRKPRRSLKNPPDSASTASDPAIDAPSSLPPNPAPSSLGHPDPDPGFGIPNPSYAPGPYDDAGWGYFTEEQLEEHLLGNLDLVYREAISRLVALGYDEDAALRAVLCNGYCYGSMDVLSNILQNAIAYLSTPLPRKDSSAVVPAAANGFTDLRHLQEHSLAGLVCLLQQMRPNLTRGDAMWCLLMSDLQVGRASIIEIPFLSLPPSATAHPSPTLDPPPSPETASITRDDELRNPSFSLCKSDEAATVAPAVFGGDIAADPRRYALHPSMKSAMRRNATSFTPTSGFRPFLKLSTPQKISNFPSEQLPPKVDSGTAAAADRRENDSSSDLNAVDSVLKALEGMNLEENGSGDPKKDVILDVINQIRDLEAQVKERKEWAQQKALQAARKLSNDLTELRLLRMEREENLRLKKGNHTLEDATMKRLTGMEGALKKVSGQVDRSNAVVRRLETENAEMRAEIEASKLSASESVRTCAEVSRREKKYLKKLMAWEKQREKMQKEIAEEKKKIKQMQKKFDEARDATKEYEVKWKQENKANEEAVKLAEEERRAKEAAKVNASRRQELLRRKIELDFQRHKDDIQRLEEEFARLKAYAVPNTMTSLSIDSEANPVKEANAKPLTCNSPKTMHRNRACVVCAKEEVSVVFLPCSHQVLCASCNENHEKAAKTCCPCCNIRIEERIRVFGASS